MTPVAIVYSDLLNRFRLACRDQERKRIERLLAAIDAIEEEFPTEVAEYQALFAKKEKK
jgi:hypothetical protein